MKKIVTKFFDDALLKYFVSFPRGVSFAKWEIDAAEIGTFQNSFDAVHGGNLLPWSIRKKPMCKLHREHLEHNRESNFDDKRCAGPRINRLNQQLEKFFTTTLTLK